MEMKKTIQSACFFSIILILTICGTAMAQEDTISPMIREGVNEVGLLGQIDLEGPDGGIDVNLRGSYGFFITQNIEVGGYASFVRVNDGDLMTYGLGGFGEYHLIGQNLIGISSLVPYVGANLGLQFTDVEEAEDASALVFEPRIGAKWFFRNYVAIDTNFYLAFASDEIYENDNELESYDFGIRLGLRVYFN